MSELPPMDDLNEKQHIMQSFQHSFDPQEIQLTIRQTALIQARELASSVAVYTVTEIDQSDLISIANLTVEIAQVFEYYLTNGGALHEG